MADARLQIIIDAVNSAQSELKQLKKDLGDIEKTSEESSKGFAKFDDVVKQGAKNIGMAAARITAFGFAAKQAFDFASYGADIQRTENAFNKVAGGAENAAAMLQGLREATQGAKTDTDLMSSATNLLALGLGNSAEEIGQISRNVETLGGAFGGTMQVFQLMMSNNSLARIDSFGIGIEEATARIDELKRAGMDANEAFDTAILQLMNEKYEAMGGGAQDAALAIDQMAAAFRNLKDLLAKEAAPAAAQFANNATELLNISRDAIQEYGFWGVAADILVEGLLDVNDTIHTQIDDMEALNAERAKLEAHETAMQNAMGTTVPTMQEYNKSLHESVKIGMDGVETYDSFRQSMENYVDVAAEVAIRQEQFKQNAIASNEAVSLFHESLRGAVGTEMENYADSQTQLRDKMGEITAKISELRAEQDKLPQSAEKYIQISQQISDLEGEYDGVIAKIGETAAAHEEATKRIMLGFLEQRLALDGLTAGELVAIQEVANQWGLIDDATLTAIQGVDGVVSAMEAGKIAPEELAGKLEQVTDAAMAGPEQLANEQAAIENLTGAVLPANDTLAQMGDGMQWLAENSPTVYDGLMSQEEAMRALADAGLPAAQGVDEVRAKSGLAEKSAASLKRILEELQSQTVTISFQWDIPALPNIPGVPTQREQAFASGGVSSGGMAWVGEQGPELVRMPAGARVYDHRTSQTINNTFNLTTQTGGRASSLRQSFEMMRALA